MCRKVISSLVFSLLNVPSTPFPPVFSPSTTTPTPLTGIRPNPCATPLWSGPSGHLADPTPNTSYEPKICIDVSGEHTPINLPTRNMGFQQERQSRLPRASIYLDILQHQAAASTREQALFTLCGNLVHWGLASGNCWRITVLLQVGLASRKLVRTRIVKKLFLVFSTLCQREERSRPKRCANFERLTKYPQNLRTES